MRDANENFQVHVLLRFSKKTGKIDTAMTGLGSALMRLWAMQNTTSSKETVVINRSTGKIVFDVMGRKDRMPLISSVRDGEDLGTCEDLGISFEELQTYTDDRFDNNGEFEFMKKEN
jgi:hypothetical protein